MKIGLVLDDSLDKTDGVQQYVLSLGEWLTSQHHDVHYLVGQTMRSDITNVHSLSRNIGVRFNGNRLSIPLPASRRAIDEVLHQHFDVLHVQMPYSPWLAGKIMRRAPSTTAIVATFHIAPYSKLVTLATYLLALWSRPSIKRLQAMFSVSTAAQSFAKQTYRRSSTVIPNTFDYTSFRAAQPLAQYDDNVLTILFLGRLVARKGCQHLLAAVRLLQQKPGLKPFRVIICGGGPLEQQLKNYTYAHQLDNVTFVGRVSEADKPRYYASADISVFPSSGGESFGIVLLEAMASGRAAVLAGDNPGYRSVLINRTDALFPATNEVALADILEQYITSKNDRLELAQYGTKLAAQYDKPVVGAKIVAAYESVIAKNSRTTA